MRFSFENYDIEKKIQTNQINVGIQIFFLLEYVFIEKFHVHKSSPTEKYCEYMNGIDQK